MPDRKLEIGKGLKALISDIDKIDVKKRPEQVKILAQSVADIDISSIEINPMQPRKDFDQQALQELSDSIAEHGLIQPITVRSLGGNRFQLISGERRYRASKMAKLKMIPAYVRVADDQGMLEMAIIENIQREDLNALEVAMAYQRLIDECELTHEQLSDRLHKTRSQVTNHLRLLKLPPGIKSGLREAKLSMGHARALAGITEVDVQLSLYHQIIDRELSVRQTEALVRNYGKPKTSKADTQAPSLPAAWQAVQKDLGKKIDSQVRIQLRTDGSGTISIPFADTDHFNDILEALQEK